MSFYVTLNHNEIFRKFTNTRISNISIGDKLVMDLDNKKVWFFMLIFSIFSIKTLK